MNKIDIKSLNIDELAESLSDFGLQKYRIQQIYKWLHKFGVEAFDEMTDLTLDLRNKLSEHYIIYSCSIAKKLVSEYDNTVKYLFRLHDGETIETVLMKYSYGYSICVSTQVGCKMACSFCASAIGGCVRNLCASEMLSQVHAVQKDLNIRISNIVLMGMGEPLDNFAQSMRFIELVTSENGLNIGMRNISLSTSGIVNRIYDMIDMNLQLTLSVSLHAPNDKIRDALMPINKKWGVNDLLKACKAYAKATSRRISFEYIMIKDVNDSQECAIELASKLKGILCHINLIPVNEVEEKPYIPSSEKRLKAFSSILLDKGYPVTLRRKLGADINASCGQLRRSASYTEGAF